MPNIFINKESDFEEAANDLLKVIDNSDEKFFLQHHNVRIENIYDFLNSNNNFYALCGVQASGKSKIIKTALNFLPDNVCKIVIDFAASVCLDDILLLIHNRLRIFCEEKNLTIKKPDSQDFLQIVSYYLKQIDNPIILVFNSFENCLKEDSDKCIEFLKFLGEFSNIKVIMSARQLTESDPKFNGLFIQKNISKSLEYEAVELYFKEKGFTIEQNVLEKFYEISGGYYGYMVMTINILKTYSLTLEEVLSEYEYRQEDFGVYLVVKLLSLASDNARNILEFLAIIRINFPIKQIFSLNLATKDEIDYLIKKNLVAVFEDTIYVKDFIKKAILKDTKTYTKFKIHKFLAEYFENQLPLKPKDRAIEISRQTMRAEIKYHTNFIKVNSVTSEAESSARLPKSVANMSYVSYSQGLKNKFSLDLMETLDNVKFDKSKSIENADGSVIFEFEDAKQANILNRADSKIKQNTLENLKQEIKNKIEDEEKQEPPKTIQNNAELLKSAQKFEKDTNYSQANKFYAQLLKNADDKAQIPVILTKMGKNSQKINDFNNAIDYLEQAYDIYEENNEKAKANKILVNIADLYKDTYKIVKAKNLYFQLLTQDIDDIKVKIKCYLGLIDLESTQNDKKLLADYFEKIFADLDKIEDNVVKSEAYFKYGLFKDDENKSQDALNYYKKAIDCCKDANENLYLSSCYSNISSIYEEQNQLDLAIQYMQMALDTDRQNNNLEGMYYCNSRYADLLKSYDKSLAKKYYLNAIDVAKMLNDDFYVASALLNYGDYCYSIQDNETAIKQYINAKKYINKDVANENIKKIDIRLNDLKIKMGKNKYMNVIEDLQENGF